MVIRKEKNIRVYQDYMGVLFPQMFFMLKKEKISQFYYSATVIKDLKIGARGI